MFSYIQSHLYFPHSYYYLSISSILRLTIISIGMNAELLLEYKFILEKSSSVSQNFEMYIPFDQEFSIREMQIKGTLRGFWSRKK